MSIFVDNMFSDIWVNNGRLLLFSRYIPVIRITREKLCWVGTK